MDINLTNAAQSPCGRVLTRQRPNITDTIVQSCGLYNYERVQLHLKTPETAAMQPCEAYLVVFPAGHANPLPHHPTPSGMPRSSGDPLHRPPHESGGSPSRPPRPDTQTTLEEVRACLNISGADPLGSLTHIIDGLSAGRLVNGPQKLGCISSDCSIFAEPSVVAAATLLIAVGALGWCAWRRLRRWRRISIFLSYRVASDQPLVEALYKRLLALKLRVWWDVKCLKPGQQWEDGFADGLFGSSIFVPVLSKAGLAPFAHLAQDSRCDNVLLEYCLALEQLERSKIKAIFPVFVGEEEAGTSRLTNFFASSGLPSCDDHVVVESVDVKALEHLQRRYGKTRLRVAERSPRSVLAKLCRYQGGFVQGDPNGALDNLAEIVRDMVHDVAAGKTIAEAQELVDGRAPPRERRRASTRSPVASPSRPVLPPLRPAGSRPAASGHAPPRRQDGELANFFAPPGVRIPNEHETVISVVKRHEASAQHRAHGALRRLAPVVKALSPRSQNKKFLAVIDRLENVVGSTAEQGALVEQHDALRRDRATCKRLRKTSVARMERVNQAITHRRAHGTAGGSAVVVVTSATGADI